MTTWLKTIMKELRSLTSKDMIEPENLLEVQDGDNIVGEFNDDLKRLFFLYLIKKRKHEEAREKMIAKMRLRTLEINEEAYAEKIAREEFRLLENIFSFSFNRFYRERSTDMVNFTLRKGWKVVWYQEKIEVPHPPSSQDPLEWSFDFQNTPGKLLN